MGHSNRMLIRKDNQILRIIKTDGDNQLIIDCITRSMPRWVNQQELNRYAKHFFYLQDLAKIELACRYGLSIQARPRNRRKPKQMEPDGIITLPESLVDEEK